MKALLALIPVTIFALANCGTTEPPPSSSSSPPPDPGGDMPNSATGPSKTCLPTCSHPSDCATQGIPLQDAAHYACNAGKCEWLGCASTAECSSALQTTKVSCVKAAGAPVADCTATCQAPSDCAVQGSALSDQNHFACTAGTCEWLGCKSTSDCTAALHSANYVCDKPPGATISTCLPKCSAASDCAVPGSGSLNDASHFACKAGQCEWLGCRSTSECQSNLHSANYVCE